MEQEYYTTNNVAMIIKRIAVLLMILGIIAGIITLAFIFYYNNGEIRYKWREGSNRYCNFININYCTFIILCYWRNNRDITRHQDQ